MCVAFDNYIIQRKGSPFSIYLILHKVFYATLNIKDLLHELDLEVRNFNLVSNLKYNEIITITENFNIVYESDELNNIYNFLSTLAALKKYNNEFNELK